MVPLRITFVNNSVGIFICSLKCNTFSKNKICKECSTTRSVKKLHIKFYSSARPKEPPSSSQPNRIALALQEEQKTKELQNIITCMKN